MTKSSQFIAKQLAHDYDWPEFIEGDEGSGKSSLGLARCHSVDPSFDVETMQDRVSWTAKKFAEIATTAPIQSAIMHDEAIEGFYGRQTISSANVTLQKMFKKFRKRRLFIDLITPDITDYDGKFRRRRPKSALRTVIVLDPIKEEWLRGIYEFYSREKFKEWFRYENGDLHRPRPSTFGFYPDLSKTPLYRLYRKLADEAVTNADLAPGLLKRKAKPRKVDKNVLEYPPISAPN